jgi:hypothetical protein
MCASPLLGAIQDRPAPDRGAPATVASELVEDALKHDIEVSASHPRTAATGRERVGDKPSPFWLVAFGIAGLFLVLLQRLEAAEDPLLGRPRTGKGLEPLAAMRIDHEPDHAEDGFRGESGRSRPRAQAPMTLPPHIIAHLQRKMTNPPQMHPARPAERHDRGAGSGGSGAHDEAPQDDVSSTSPSREGWEIVLPAYNPWTSDDRR